MLRRGVTREHMLTGLYEKILSAKGLLPSLRAVNGEIIYVFICLTSL